MKILITSGFLGAGKTTFIKELIKRSGTFPVVLENEYGDNSIDADELRTKTSGKKELEVLEFMEGCVCCTMKDSFINSVLTVYSSLSPEYLIIEPTGVGRLSNIISNLTPILHGDVTLLKPIVVLAPRSFKQNMAEFPELYKDQIANAQTVVFSKCENESYEILTETAEAIRAINPDAEIIKEHYTGQSDAWWRSVMELPANEAEISKPEGEADSFTQITINNAHLNNPGELIMLLEDCLRGVCGHVVRAKGTVPVGIDGCSMLRFDLADNLYSIGESPAATNQCVFIGEYLDAAALHRRMGDDSFSDAPVWKAPQKLSKNRPVQPRYMAITQ